MNKYSIKTRSSRSIIKLGIVLIIIVAAILTAGFVAMTKVYNQNLSPVSANQKRLTITIANGSSSRDIARILRENQLIRSTWAFEQYVRNQGVEGELQAGTYTISPSQSVAEIVDVLTQGKISSNLVTIPPGYRIDQVRKLLLSYGYNAEEVEEALNPVTFKDHPLVKSLPKGARLEGYIYPESLLRDDNTKPRDLIKQYLDLMNEALTPAIRAGIKKQGLTLHQGIILASIVEQEVSGQNSEDRPRVAQVFLKRLEQNMALESDATAPYGAVLNGVTPSLTYDSPYNTYKNSGLPPGPISNVSTSSLEAVANPSDTDWLYFVSGDDGVTYFSRTLEEHEALTNQHCTTLCGN